MLGLTVLVVILPVNAAQDTPEPSCDRRIRGEGEESSLVILKPDAVQCMLYVHIHV